MPKLNLNGKWVPRQIHVLMVDKLTGHERKDRVMGEAIGPIGMHRALEKDGTWCVTSTNINLRIARFDKLEDARKFAEILYVRCLNVFKLKNREMLVGALPRLMGEWIKECDAKRKLVSIVEVHDRMQAEEYRRKSASV